MLRFWYKASLQANNQRHNEIIDNVFILEEGFYNEVHFNRILRLEEKRTERSKKPFLLLFLNVSNLNKVNPTAHFLKKLRKVLVSCLRETDIIGWHENHAVIGIIFTEITSISEDSKKQLTYRLKEAFHQILAPKEVDQIKMSFHVYPEETGQGKDEGEFKHGGYPKVEMGKYNNKCALKIKRVMDVVGSLMSLTIFSPLFVIVGVAIKLTSEGPVLFKQERLGLYGERFNFLKFRSMYTNCDENPHHNYIKDFIGGPRGTVGSQREGEAVIYKMNNDHRITPIGTFLRKTSLDELPQFINVLKGEMSLVGPRPPIPYEYDLYDIWHRRRLLELKPGITGLWQVKGRSSTTFDEMVRLDLRYLRKWSLWLDVKILFKTLGAVFSGEGAY
jgi:lipopolysaccharide/colanic/teichoic acid biosynthesis glycosyltransferase